jgi:hypothetical protein
VNLEIAYNPQVIEIIDANPNLSGIQVEAGSIFNNEPAPIIPDNQVDPVNGHILFAATIVNKSFTGDNAELLVFTWRPKTLGTSAITLVKSDLFKTASGDQSALIAHTVANGSVQTPAECGSGSALSGVVTLQGRANFQGVRVVNAVGQTAETDAAGRFSIETDSALQISYPGYLSAAAPQNAAIQSAGQRTASLGSITLLGGDVNRDNTINIFDLAYMAQHYGDSDALADLNNDNTANIMDLALAAGNYNRQGPLTNWQ